MVVSILACPAVGAEEVRYFEQNGVTYRETRQVGVPAAAVYQPTAVTSPVSGCQGRLATQTQQVVRSYWTPVTDYRWETTWVNRWNPFAEPYVAYRYVGRTHWEPRTELVRVPVVCCCPANLPSAVVAAPAATGPSMPTAPVAPVAAADRNSLQRPLHPALQLLENPSVARRETYGGVARVGEEPPR